jgi:hypothetical protein
MSEPRFDSPLAGHAAPHNLTISITEIVDRGMIDLRGDPENRSFAAAVDAVLGSSLPRLPRTSVVTNELSVLWLSVDQWLVQCPRAQASGLARRLQAFWRHSLARGRYERCPHHHPPPRRRRARGHHERRPVDLTAPASSRDRCGGCASGNSRRWFIWSMRRRMSSIFMSSGPMRVFAWEWLVATGHGAAQVRLFKPQAAPTRSAPSALPGDSPRSALLPRRQEQIFPTVREIVSGERPIAVRCLATSRASCRSQWHWSWCQSSR